MLMFTSIAGVVYSPSVEAEKSYSHTILSEYFTITTCEPCKYAHRALRNLFYGEYHPFWYITYVYNKNEQAKQRKSELNIFATPTVVWDDDYRRDIGASGTQSAMDKYNTSIIKCGNRNVKDIDLDLSLEWLGATNEEPADGSSGWAIEDFLSWTVSDFEINVEITNNEASQYNGHLHVYVTEVNSSWWDDKFGDPYTFEFKDYAYNQDTTISAGGTWTGNKIWDCAEHDDGQGRSFENMTQDNTAVIASVFDEDNDDYVDETDGVIAGYNTDPKTFNIFFGNTSPPPMVIENISINMFYPQYGLNFSSTYYWKIDVWDKQGNPTYGDIWSFTTRGNDAPYIPSGPNPWNGSIEVPIKTNLTWIGGDPDDDDVFYDVYFGENPFEMNKVSSNQTDDWWEPHLLEFYHTYYWKIVAWDEYGLVSTGPVWHFTTQVNQPPDPAHDPYPKDGETAVPGDVIIHWNGSDPNFGDTIKFDVYFDDAYPPTIREKNQTENYYDPYGQQNLPLYEPYYWRIITWDSQGLSSDSGIWEFTTGINDPPSDPIFEGPSNGKKGIEYDYTVVSTDPNNHSIRYKIDWDDGTDDLWTDYYPSGVTVNVSHIWEARGNYEIQIRAQDEFGAYCNNTVYFEMSIPRLRSPIPILFNFLMRLSERFPMFEKLMFFFEEFG
jgi:hypothetical protein